jgi:hypothetical protein
MPCGALGLEPGDEAAGVAETEIGPARDRSQVPSAQVPENLLAKREACTAFLRTLAS